MLKVVGNYCSDTSLHGFIYITQSTRHKIERIFWSIAIFASFIQTGILIYKFMIENQANPIVIYTDQNAISVQDINFPSVSFCPGILLKTMEKPFEYHEIKLMLKNQTMNIKNLSLKELKMMQVASLVAKDQYMSTNFQNVSIPTNDFIDILGSFGTFFGEPLYGTIFRPYFMANWTDKYPVNFTNTLWKTGFCYTFNFPNSSQMFHLNSTSSDFNYMNVTMLGTERRRVSNYKLEMSYPIKAQNPGKGLHLGFSEMQKYQIYKVYSDYLNDSIPNKDYDGLKLWFHDAFEVLSHDSINLQVRLPSYSKITIVPKILKVDDSMMDFKLEDRQCYLENELELRFFKVYNRINCEHECLATLTLKTCGCVQFYMVRDQGTRICGTVDENCLRNVEDEFINVKLTCMCYEPCETVKYEVKKTYDWTRKFFFSIMDGRSYNEIEAKIELGVQSILATRKRKVFTSVDIFSLIGGFLGLFAGFSFLSAGEIILHFIIYPLASLKSRRSSKIRPVFDELPEKSKNAIVSYLLIYLEESSIHSFKYFGDIQKKFIERLVWFLFFILSMILAFLMVQKVYEKLKESEIYMSLDGKPTSVENIPFPAFTLIPDINDGHGFRYIPMIENTEKHDSRWKRDDHDEYNFSVINQAFAVICRTLNSVGFSKDPFNFSSTSDFVDMLRSRTHRERPWFIYRKAKWNRDIDPPFAEILTHYGFGYTFNLVEQTRLINVKRTSRDFFYTYDGHNSTIFPWKARAGYNFGLDLTFRINKLWQGCHNFDSYIIHPPNELPINSQIVRHEDLVTSDVFITPEIIKTDDDLKNSSTAVCEYYRFNDCALKFESFSNFQNYDDIYKAKGICNCLPLCNYVSYSYEVVTKVYKKVQNTTISLLWKDNEYYAQVRYQQFKIVDFLSYVGGILGLFAGISVLSIVEFFYFFTLRLMSDLCRYLL
ncbi:unnamed protein product [Chironomus riparius]|uniref:Uncharacterized protein n=1 Tax=Chironomus riparius TaxID=315576 RepID=A0A9N9WTF3_9DIPT|nr:unnamed protein product [Chironomus riparius]